LTLPDVDISELNSLVEESPVYNGPKDSVGDLYGDGYNKCDFHYYDLTDDAF